MQKIEIPLSVTQAAQQASEFLVANGFTLFAHIDHSANATKAALELPPSQVIVFGNPLAGTKLLQSDITMSLELPLKVAFVCSEGSTFLLHPTSADFQASYNVADHPVLEKIDQLYANLAATLAAK